MALRNAWLCILLLSLAAACAGLFIACGGDDDDDENDDDEGDDDDNDTDDDDDDDDTDDDDDHLNERELSIDDGTAESSLCYNGDHYEYMGNSFHPGGGAAVVRVKVMFCDLHGQLPPGTPPPDFSVNIFAVKENGLPIGEPVHTEEFTPDDWNDWEGFELNKNVVVGLEQPRFLVAIGPVDTLGLCLGADQNNSEGGWAKHVRTGWQPKDDLVYMVRAIILQ